MEKLFDLLKIVESVQLAPMVLEPEPMVFAGGVGAVGTATSRGPGGPDGQGDWANNRSGGFRTEENQVHTDLSSEVFSNCLRCLRGRGLNKQFSHSKLSPVRSRSRSAMRKTVRTRRSRRKCRSGYRSRLWVDRKGARMYLRRWLNPWP